MRSWVLTILGALLAMLLWRVAQMVRIEGFDPVADQIRSQLNAAQAAQNPPTPPIDPTKPTKTKEEFAAKLAKFSELMTKANKKLEVSENLELEKMIQEASLGKDYTRPGSLIDTFVSKYLLPGDRLTTLTNLVTDARKRLSALESQLEKSKAEGEKAKAEAEALKQPENLPAPTETSSSEPRKEPEPEPAG